MIRIPICFFCKKYDFKTGKCPAYTQGVPDDVLFDKKRDGKECGNGFSFEEREWKETQLSIFDI